MFNVFNLNKIGFSIELELTFTFAITLCSFISESQSRLKSVTDNLDFLLMAVSIH